MHPKSRPVTHRRGQPEVHSGRFAALNRTRLAEQAGLRRPLIVEIDNGPGEPRTSTVRKLAGALSVKPPGLMLPGEREAA